MVVPEYDTIIIGMGLGASAIAQRLSATGARIAMTPGVGCARFKHLDGGLISPALLEHAFGSLERAPLYLSDGHTTFRRDLLEGWAIEQVRGRVTIVENFDDLRVVPHEEGSYAVLEESGERVLVGSQIILTEGASPKIGIAARIRTDFEPEDLLHFGRVIVPGVGVARPASGTWRTSWNMPAWYTVVPHSDGAIVGASARIENIMRAGRDGRDVVEDLLASPLAGHLGLRHTTETVGMELVPLQPLSSTGRVVAGEILITPDANGAIDPRSLQRYDDILTAGTRIGDLITRNWPTMPEWEHHHEIWDVRSAERTPYHDSSETSFIEEGAGKSRGLLGILRRR